MGVRGLTTFINREKRFYEDHYLHSSKLIIDGCGLAPTIYFDPDLNIDPGNHGGEHQTYYIQCAQFFRNMASCGVQCYVIFDGGYDRNGLKFETLKRREQEAIDAIKELNETLGEGVQTIASYCMDVFVSVLDDLDVPWTSSLFEADRDIAVLANEFNCPVLGQDSDFFIMDINEGYIPLEYLNWKELCSFSSNCETESCPALTSPEPNRNYRYLQCKRYRLASFSTYFYVVPSIMPMFASLNGNDYLKGFNLDEFYGAIKQRYRIKPDRRLHPRRKGFWRFCNLLYHLTFFTTIEECIEEVLMHVHIDERSKVKADLMESCSMYDVTSPSEVVDFFKEGDSPSQLDENFTKDSENLTVENTTAEEIEMLMPAICESILYQGTVFLCVKNEKLSEPRASACCDHLLRIIAGIMLVDEKTKAERKEDGKVPTIDVFHRDGCTHTCTKMEPKWHVKGFGLVPSYKEIPRMPGSSLRSLLLAALGFPDLTFNNIPESFHLMLLASVYCYKNADPPVSPNLIHALVLGWIQGLAWYLGNTQKLQQEGLFKATEEDIEISWNSREVQNILINYEPVTRKSLSKFLDLDASHAFMQWIFSNTFTRHLNLLLQKVLSLNLDVMVWYNGILIHNLYIKLNDEDPSRHQDWIENCLMLGAPTAYQFYQDIMSFFKDHLPFPESSNEKSSGSFLRKSLELNQQISQIRDTLEMEASTSKEPN